MGKYGRSFFSPSLECSEDILQLNAYENKNIFFYSVLVLPSIFDLEVYLGG